MLPEGWTRGYNEDRADERFSRSTAESSGNDNSPPSPAPYTTPSCHVSPVLLCTAPHTVLSFNLTHRWTDLNEIDLLHYGKIVGSAMLLQVSEAAKRPVASCGIIVLSEDEMIEERSTYLNENVAWWADALIICVRQDESYGDKHKYVRPTSLER